MKSNQCVECKRSVNEEELVYYSDEESICIRCLYRSEDVRVITNDLPEQCVCHGNPKCEKKRRKHHSL
jgi:recombinational DNA repair protein (RecF pathway)